MRVESLEGHRSVSMRWRAANKASLKRSRRGLCRGDGEGVREVDGKEEVLLKKGGKSKTFSRCAAEEEGKR